MTMTAVCREKCHNMLAGRWKKKSIELEAVRPAVPDANDLLFPPLGVLALSVISLPRQDARSSYTEMGVPVDIS